MTLRGNNVNISIMASREDLFVRPLFFDSLSGEFLPPTDEKKRLHTLGRLAYATFQPEHELPQDEEQSLFVYDIPWAAGAVSRIVCSIDIHSGKYAMGALTLHADGIDYVAFHDTNGIPGNLGQFLLVDEGGRRETHFPLNLGDPLNIAKQFVANRAQAFFDQLVA